MAGSFWRSSRVIQLDKGTGEVDLHKRMALQLASQLPDDVDDARLVVSALSDLLENWLIKPSSQPESNDKIIRLAVSNLQPAEK
jgi:hypothetical protein